jgi:hypothetical protein
LGKVRHGMTLIVSAIVVVDHQSGPMSWWS